MAKEFDFKKNGKKQRAFRTPMLNSKVGPAQARLVGRARQEAAKNPNGVQAGVSPYKMIASAILKASARLLKPSAATGLEKAAKITASNKFKFGNAAIFNTAAKSPAARGSVDRVVTKAVIKAASKDGQDNFFIGKTTQEVMRLGEEMTDSFRLLRGVVTPREYRVVQRGIAKILGKAGRSNPAYREIGRDFRNSSRPTFKSNLGKRMK